LNFNVFELSLIFCSIIHNSTETVNFVYKVKGFSSAKITDNDLFNIAL